MERAHAEDEELHFDPRCSFYQLHHKDTGRVVRVLIRFESGPGNSEKHRPEEDDRRGVNTGRETAISTGRAFMGGGIWIIRAPAAAN